MVPLKSATEFYLTLNFEVNLCTSKYLYTIVQVHIQNVFGTNVGGLRKMSEPRATNRCFPEKSEADIFMEGHEIITLLRKEDKTVHSGDM